jgi:hypothetical protein
MMYHSRKFWDVFTRYCQSAGPGRIEYLNNMTVYKTVKNVYFTRYYIKIDSEVYEEKWNHIKINFSDDGRRIKHIE